MGGSGRPRREGAGGEVAWQPVSARLLWELAILGRGRPGAGSAGAAPRSLEAWPRGGRGRWAPSGSGDPGRPSLAPAETLLRHVLLQGATGPLLPARWGGEGSVTKSPPHPPE